MKISKQLKDYIEEHQLCEACFKPAQGLPHHIKHRGAGGTDDYRNLLRLCHSCHFGYCHSSTGIKGLIEKYPHLYGKVTRQKPCLAVIITKGG